VAESEEEVRERDIHVVSNSIPHYSIYLYPLYSSTTTFHPDASAIVRDLLVSMDEHMLGRESVFTSSSSRERSGTLDSRTGDGSFRGSGGGGAVSPRRNRSGSNTVPMVTPGMMSKFQQLAQDRMGSILRNRELYGYPVNIPFTGMFTHKNSIPALIIRHLLPVL